MIKRLINYIINLIFSKMEGEKKYVKDGKERALSDISIVIQKKRYMGINENLAKSLGFVDADGNGDVDALLASCGWMPYVPEEVTITLDDVINQKVYEVEDYGNSEAVKQIIINGETTWYDDAKRASLRNLFEAQKAEGQTTTTLWVNGKPIAIIPIDDAIKVLNKIEVYAGEVYNTTQAHIVDVKASNSVAEAEAFDVTEGYPEIKTFTFE